MTGNSPRLLVAPAKQSPDRVVCNRRRDEVSTARRPFALVLLGLFLAGMALTASPASASHTARHRRMARMHRMEARMHRRHARALAAHGRYMAAGRQRMMVRRQRR